VPVPMQPQEVPQSVPVPMQPQEVPQSVPVPMQNPHRRSPISAGALHTVKQTASSTQWPQLQEARTPQPPKHTQGVSKIGS
jgi:hypothetical protein